MLQRLLGAMALLCLLSGCGTTVPQFDLANHGWTNEADFVQSVTTHIHCEMRNAVLDTYDNLARNGGDAEWLKTWSAKVALTLLVDEKTGVNPDVAITNAAFTLGLGASLSSEASRELEIDWFAVFAEYFKERRFQKVNCDAGGTYPIEGYLGLREALFAGAFPASLNNNISNPFKSGGRLQIIQHTVYFYIQASGNATPSWKFTRVSADTGGHLIESSHDRKDTLLVTMGPTQLEDAGRPLREVQPIQAVDESFFSKKVGIAVENGLIGR